LENNPAFEHNARMKNQSMKLLLCPVLLLFGLAMWQRSAT